MRGGEGARTLPPSVLPDISPTGGEIGWPHSFRKYQTLKEVAVVPKLPISPPVGEMSGRTEGGAKERERTASRPTHRAQSTAAA